MSREQISMLLGKRESGTPLYLIVALEELRTLGHFEEIDARIREIPDQVQPLFRWIMRRLEDDPGFVDDQGRKVGPKLLSDFGRLLGASRFGLSHQELVELLSPEDRFGHVAALERLLRPYLMQRGELLDFFHLQLKQAILDLYLETEELHRSAHARLADHFQGKADPSRDGGWNGRARDLNEVIHHLLAAGRVSEALHALTSLAFVVARGRCAQVQSLLADYQSTLEQTGAIEAADGSAGLSEWRAFVRRHSHLLSLHPQQAYQAAFNQARRGPVEEAAARHYRHRMELSPWLERRNRPDTAANALLAHHVTSANIPGLHLAEDGREALAIGERGEELALSLSTGTVARSQWPTDGKVVLASDDLDRLVVVVGGQELRLITRATREVRWRATWQNAIIDVTADRACDRIMILDEQGE